jgi:phosphoglycolate phosphatase-like HAD superfamily hydrolase
MIAPDLLALDFDGVLCDGLPEYFASSWRTGQGVWGWQALAADLEPAFRRLRPVVLHGWEMPLLLWALQQGYDEAEIAGNWSGLAPQLLKMAQVTTTGLQQALDQTRRAWIARDQADWLSYQRLYPGIETQMRRWLKESQPLVIVTTKGQQFVQDLLASRELVLPSAQIYGKEVQQSKAKLLAQLVFNYPEIWFVEDRLPTLEEVSGQAGLQSVRLFHADWGYNTVADRQRARGTIQGLGLDQFCGEFADWLVG